MKNKIEIALMITLFFISCEKEKNTFKSENPLPTFLATSGLYQNVSYHENGHKEENGLRFMPLAEGKITSFISKLPVVTPVLKMVLWDGETKIPIAVKICNNVGGDTLFPLDNPVPLIKGHTYCLSVVSKGMILRERELPFFPTYIGNIALLGNYVSYLTDTNLRKYPDNETEGEYFGDYSFEFIRTK